MAYVTPQTHIYLYKNIPLPSNYEHTFYFDSKSSQDSYFASKHTTALTYAPTTYQNITAGVIRIGINIKTVYNVNYLSFTNSETDGETGYEKKTYYCFVTNVIYINENTTEIHYTVDVMQTYLFQYSSNGNLKKKMFVDRTHIPKSADKLTHSCMLNDEGLNLGMELRPVIKATATPFAFNTLTAYVFYTGHLIPISDTANIIPNNLTPKEVELTDPNNVSYKTIAVKTPNNNAYIYNPEMLGNGYYGIDRGLINPLNMATFVVYDINGNIYAGGEDGGLHVGTGYLGLQYFIAVLNALGKSDAIVKIVMMPSAMRNKNTGQNNVLTNNGVEFEQTIQSDSSFGNYTPKNYKLYGYPYNYFIVDNNENDKKTFIPQFVNDDVVDTGIKFKFMSSVLNQVVHIFPTNYIISEPTYGLSKTIGVEVPYITSAYKDWLANSEIARNLAIQQHKVNSVINIVGGSFGKDGSGIETGEYQPTLTGEQGDWIASPKGKTLKGTGGFIANAAKSTGKAMTNSYNFITNLTQQKAQMFEIAPSFVGSLGGNMSFITNRLGFKITNMRVGAGVAKRIDDYFSVYGYKISDWQTPQLKVRANWTFIKTAGCAVTGDIPKDFESAIDQIFDNGITFWANTSSFMDYGDFTNPDP